MIVKIEHKAKELYKIREKGYFYKTYKTGLQCLDEIYKPVKGFPLFVAGSPHHGKSEFTLELALSLCLNEKFKVCAYLGEAGNIEIAIAEICSKIAGKPYTGKFAMSESELMFAHTFVSEHFTFIDLETFKIKEFYTEVEKAQDELGYTFDVTILDPFNDATNQTSEHGGTHIWLEEDLKFIRQQSKKYNRLDIVVNHIGDTTFMVDKETGNRYSPPALPSEWAGGRVWHRRAFTMLLVYRPPRWLKDENGQEYGENKTIIYNQKAKPKGTGKIGIAVIEWDFKKNRYFERLIDSKGRRGMKYMLNETMIPDEENPLMFNDVLTDENPF